jgi:hypothetical protein
MLYAILVFIAWTTYLGIFTTSHIYNIHYAHICVQSTLWSKQKILKDNCTDI